MKDLYAIGIVSRQALHQHLSREKKATEQARDLFEKADRIRGDHPGIGCRKLALSLVCAGWGRDKIEALLLKGGYRLCPQPNRMRTTRSRKSFHYSNLIEGMELRGINEVVQTDITYFRLKERFYYLSFLIDVYSRRIVGYSLSKTLQAQGSIRALKKMIGLRGPDKVDGLIHHSDRGTQYIERSYRALLEKHHIRPSMCIEAWQNAYTERINRTIKEEYLQRWNIDTYTTLARRLAQAVNHYNFKRPHQRLSMMSPVDFENKIKEINPEQRPVLKIYKQPINN